jgi:hypothetical protein
MSFPYPIREFLIKHRGLLLLTGIVLMTIGNLLWRLICERWVLFFKIYEIIESINKKVK